ncbi:MAG: type II toxin-antitoxin system VapC family toxin [Calothrix sp. CSU_2_0]|nr:type II toxin-antitoxin system VapC family toxin [Calothrix sp. CSU_2_0]
MSYLVDTNILLRNIQETHPMHESSVQSVRNLLALEEALCIIPQNLIELWVVATRPVEVNGLGLSVADALQELEQIKAFFILLPDTTSIFTVWESLIRKYQIMGKPSHDARLVAAMIAHNITHILTFNINDFKKFSEVTAIEPRDI